jgi:hypothetical protein
MVGFENYSGNKMYKSDGNSVNIADLFDALYKALVIDKNAGVDAKLTGSNLQEQKTEADAVGGVLTFSKPIQYIELYNTDETNAGVFTVNGIAITVPVGKVFNSGIGGTPSAQVTITGATKYIVSRYA